MDNADRFVKAYNTLDHSLRKQYNFKRSMSFADLIRKSVSFNSVIRKYEDDLVDYGRLRNAIIHSNDSYEVMAQPNNNVVEHMERIAKLVSTPPLVSDSIHRNNVLCMDAKASLKEAMVMISSSGYSNIPVYDHNHFVGVANGQRLLDVMGSAIEKGAEISNFIENNNIGDIVKSLSVDNYYDVKSAKLTLEQALDLFFKNRKLLVIILTPSGSVNERPVGIITVSDIIEINSILENF